MAKSLEELELALNNARGLKKAFQNNADSAAREVLKWEQNIIDLEKKVEEAKKGINLTVAPDGWYLITSSKPNANQSLIGARVLIFDSKVHIDPGSTHKSNLMWDKDNKSVWGHYFAKPVETKN